MSIDFAPELEAMHVVAVVLVGVVALVGLVDVVEEDVVAGDVEGVEVAVVVEAEAVEDVEVEVEDVEEEAEAVEDNLASCFFVFKDMISINIYLPTDRSLLTQCNECFVYSKTNWQLKSRRSTREIPSYHTTRGIEVEQK